MSAITIRPLEVADVDAARRLSNQNPDVFGRYAIARLWSYFDITDMGEPASSYADRQRVMLGAYQAGQMVGTVCVANTAAQMDQDAAVEAREKVQGHFSEYELTVHAILQKDIDKSIIAPPSNSLLVHTLCVDSLYRRQGVAMKLLREAINSLSASELTVLYVQVARTKGHRRLCESVGFKVLRQRFSFSDRLQFGIWGSILLQFDLTTRSPSASQT